MISKMNRARRARRLASLAAALALPAALVLSACSTSTAASEGGASSSATDELVIGSSYEHEGFDPMNPVSASANGERLVSVLDTLLRVAPDGSTVGQLAESMESKDGLTWTLKLREGVTFTDDTPLDADAVIYNIERHRAPDSPSSSKLLLADLVSLTASDDRTVVFVLGKPNFSFPYLFTASGALGLIGSPTALEADAEGFNRAPIGAGPYIVEEWVPDDHVTMTANPDYWAGEPAVKTLTYRVLPDPQSRENALVAGEVDIATIAGNFETVTSNDKLVAHTQGARGGMALLPNTSVAPLNDQRVRTAVQLAFDPANSKQVFFGSSDIWDGASDNCLPFGADQAQCEPSTVKHDLEKAKKLVAEYVADGNSPAIEILTTAYLGSYGEYVDQVLKSIGLESTINSVSPADYIPTLYGGKYVLGMWQMVPSDSFYPLGYTIFSSTARNVIQQQDAEFQAAIEAGVNSDTQEGRDAGMRAMQQEWNDKALVTWLSPIPQVLVSQKNVDMGDDYLGGFAFYPADITVS